MKKTAILTFTLLSLAIIPAIAQIQTGRGGLGQVWTDFQSYSTDLQDYLQNNLSDNLKRDEVQSQLNGAKGELNIPNPVAAGKKVRDDLIDYSYRSESKSNRFENNSAVRGNLVSNELNRVITRGTAESVLGRNGQIRAKAKLENIQNTLESVADVNNDLDTDIKGIIQQASTLDGNRGTFGTKDFVSAADALLTQGIAALLTATQETLKIQKEQIKIVGESYAKSTQSEQSLQYSNLNLANISQQAEEANRARRVDTSTEAARLLRATSQIDLFGRKVDN